MKFYGFIVLLVLAAMPVKADNGVDYFIYEDEAKTVVIGVDESGWAQRSLTIPAAVTLVREGSFFGVNHLSSLYIDGGNPSFETGALDDVKETLTYINLGDGMSATKMYSLFIRLGTLNQLEQVVIMGYQGGLETPIEWEDDLIKNILTEDVVVVLPAALVDNQVFGDAKVFGRFTITNQLTSFCGRQSFYDEDDGSNMLFYIPTQLRAETKQIYIERVKTIVAGQGVLIHNVQNTSSYADLPRVNSSASYPTNMLVGVTEPTYIEKVDGDKTNLVLSGGAFHPLSNAGTIPANKAYLQLPTVEYEAMGSLGASGLTFLETPVETNGIGYSLVETESSASGEWFTLGGQRLGGQPVKPGLYLRGNKKVIVK